MKNSDHQPSSSDLFQSALDEVNQVILLLKSENQEDDLRAVAGRIHRSWKHFHQALCATSKQAMHDVSIDALARSYTLPVLSADEQAFQFVFSDLQDSEIKPDISYNIPLMRAGLLRQALSLHKAILEASSSHNGSFKVALSTIAIVTGCSLLVFVMAYFGGIDDGARWQGSYFDNREFKGKPFQRYDRYINFDFKKAAPSGTKLNEDNFSIRWETCLVLDEKTKLQFSLKSNDGSKLFINGDKIIDNWGNHSSRSRDGTITLDAGSHYLVVEYYEATLNGNIQLSASFDGSKPKQIPIDRLEVVASGEPHCD